MRSIHGSIRLPSPQWFDDAVAIVGLDDVSKIDAPALRVAETRVQSIRGVCDRIPFCLVVNEGSLTSHSYLLKAEVRRFGKNALAKGDFLTTIEFPWKKEDKEDKILEVQEV